MSTGIKSNMERKNVKIICTKRIMGKLGEYFEVGERYYYNSTMEWDYRAQSYYRCIEIYYKRKTSHPTYKVSHSVFCGSYKSSFVMDNFVYEDDLMYVDNLFDKFLNGD